MNESSATLDLRSLTELPSLELKARRIVEAMTAGRNRSSRHGLSTDFSDHRNYVPGDDLRHIDWKVYGRSDRFFLKRFTDETSATVVILLDCSRSMSFQSADVPMSKWDYGLLLSAAIFWMGLRQNLSVGVYCHSSKSVSNLEPASSKGQFTKFQNSIGSVECTGMTDFDELSHWLPPQIGKRKMIFVISDFFDELESLTRFFRRLEFDHHDVSAIQLFDPAEPQGPNLHSEFVDPETNRKIVVDSTRIQQSYRKVFAQFQSGLNSIWSRTRTIGMMSSTISKPSGLLQQLMNRRNKDARLR